MKTKIFYSIIAVLLVAIVIWTYMEVGGNPYEKNKAKESLISYMNQTYPDMDYKIKRSAKYVNIDESYRFEVIKKGPYDVKTTYIFDVYRYEPYEVFNDTIHKSSVDKETSKILNAQAEQYILTLLQKKVPSLYQVDTDVEVYNNDITQWTPELKTPKPILIMLDIEKGDLTKEQIFQQMKAIQKQLNDESIDYYLAEAGYRSISNGEEDIMYIDFSPDQKITLKDIN